MDDAAQNIVHDARTGFHDIRLPPMFEPPDYLPVFLAAAALLLILWIIFRVRRPDTGASTAPAPTPEEAALAQFEKLEALRVAEQISARNFGAQVSAGLREFLGAMLNFPAAEFTNREVLRSIVPALKTSLPCAGSEALGELVELTREVLTLSERITYAPNAEEQAATCGSEVAQLCEQATNIVRETAKQIKREDERTLSVTRVGVTKPEIEGTADAL